MSRIFVFEETHLDLSKMGKYGKTQYLFEGSTRRPLRDQKLEAEIVSQLHNLSFNPKKDYIGIVGSHLAVCIFVSTVVSTYGAVNCLVFDAVQQDYFVRSMGHLIDQDIFDVSRSV